jgi:predicted nucleotidyltransferase
VETSLASLATELGTTDRTLRRAVRDGLVRCVRSSPRKLDVPIGEQAYLQANWSLLAQLRAALRTEPSLRAAVLFGAYARGEQQPSSLDLLVDAEPGAGLRRVAARLRSRLELPLRLVALTDAEKAPVLLAEIVREGRVLVDREGGWSRLVEGFEQLERAAARERARIELELDLVFGPVE